MDADQKLAALLAHALDEEERFNAIQGLRQLKDARVLQPFLDFILTDPDIDVRREAAWGVGELVRDAKIPFLEAIQPLLIALEDGNPVIRGHAILGLSRIYGENETEQIVAPRIIALLSDPDANVRYQAVFWMRKFGDERARPALSDLLIDPDPAVKELAEGALDLLDHLKSQS